MKMKMSFLLLFFCYQLNAETRYWIGASSGKWNNDQNWSFSSGGVGGASTPTTTDDVIFDGNGIADCVINVDAYCNTLVVKANYTGTITQQAKLTIGAFRMAGNSIWSGGVFVGGSEAIVNFGSLTISGTSFTSTRGTLSIGDNFSLKSGAFSHNNGTVSFDLTLNLGDNSIEISNMQPFIFHHVNIMRCNNSVTFKNSFAIRGTFTQGRHEKEGKL